jgi:DNA-binding NarL/FixJ family response regulator
MARRTLSAVLQRDDLTVVAEATTGSEAIDLARFYHPEIVVLDDRLADIESTRVARSIAEASPNTSVVVLAAEPEDAAGLRVLRAGAVGYISKSFDPEMLPRLIRSVIQGEAAISRQLSLALINSYQRGTRPGAGLRPVRSPLTDREWEVLDLLASGERTEAIARSLVLSTETVRSHLKNLYRKLGVRSRSEAVEAAERLRELVG